MKIVVEETGSHALIEALRVAPEKIRRGVAREAFKIGARAVELIKRQYRTTASATSTARRSGRLVRSYDHKVARDAGDVTLVVGAIRPTDQGQVPIHARVHEGFDASGNRVEQFIIRAKNAPYLHFPIRSGGGLSVKSIAGWVKVKQVILRPRPALEPISDNLSRTLTEAAASVVADAL